MPYSAVAIELATAVAVEINGRTWTAQPEAFTAQRLWYAKFQDSALATIQVSVIALTKANARITRAPLQTRDIGIWVDFQRMALSHDSLSEMDGYVNFVDQVQEYFSDGHRLASPLNGYFYESAVFFSGEMWSPQRLYRDHVFEAAIELNLRGQA